VRGKISKLLLIPLILSLLAIAIPDLSYSVVGNTKFYLSPETVSGWPGDRFDVDVMISDAEGVWALEFTLDFAPFMSVLVPINVVEGPFLAAGGTTWPVKKVDNFQGTVEFGNTLLNVPTPATPVSGNGILATITFEVLEAGDSPLALVNTGLLNEELEALPHNAFSGAYTGYAGPVNLVRTQLLDRRIPVGGTQIFHTKVTNEGEVPIYAKAIYKMTKPDGTSILLSSEKKTWLAVDGLDATYMDWDVYGTSPYLDDGFDGSYITTGSMSNWHAPPPSTDYEGETIGLFSFEDITPEPGKVITNVYIDFKPDFALCDFLRFHLYDGATYIGWFDGWWVDFFPESDYVGELYYDGTGYVITSYVNTYAGINNLKVALEYRNSPDFVYYDYGIPVGLPIDLNGLVVKVFTIDEVPPHANYEMTPIEFYCEDPMTYITTVKCLFSYYGTWFNEGRKTRTVEWKVVP
jgi:hypothetical protein